MTPSCCRRYAEQIPVTFVDGRRHDFWRVDEARLRAALALSRPAGMPPIDVAHGGRGTLPVTLCMCSQKSSLIWSPGAPRSRERLSERSREHACPPTPALRRDIPDATVARLPEYLRTLSRLAEDGVASVSSEELAAAVGVRSRAAPQGPVPPRLLRRPGGRLRGGPPRLQISRALGLTQDWPVAIVGMGNLGHALASYSGFATKGFRIVALLDDDPPSLGEQHRRARDPAARRVLDARHVADPELAIGVIATPAPRRRSSATGWSAAGIGSILNFAPCRARRARRASTCARSTCRPSCRSSPSTSSARRSPPARPRTVPGRCR